MIWNIGYAGLDKDMDFFYDGGKKVRTPENRLKENMTGILQALSGKDSIDIVMLQEVDRDSKRSYETNEVKLLEDQWKGQTFYGKNYEVFFVPLPFNQPMGKVNSGLLSLSRYNPSSVERLSLPGRYGWPKQLFMLDRCLLVMHYPLKNGRELLVVNVHHEAFDNGEIRDQQMNYLKTFLLKEADKGNYLVVAGDWNQCPPDLNPNFEGEVFDTIDHKGIDPQYLPEGWQWAFDNTVPSNRRLDVSYRRGKTRVTLIDFFLVSPNLKVSGCKASPMGFTYSDHQSVQVTISFR
jgi:endonuclease/exonuclease/phosphatase family metal-dependent hydrolase